MEEYLETKVTKIGNYYYCRLIDFSKNEVIDEMACELKDDIAYCFSYMLRWHNKSGGMSPMAEASRNRHMQKGYPTIHGKILYPAYLIQRKRKIKENKL